MYTYTYEIYSASSERLFVVERVNGEPVVEHIVDVYRTDDDKRFDDGPVYRFFQEKKIELPEWIWNFGVNREDDDEGESGEVFEGELTYQQFILLKLKYNFTSGPTGFDFPT